MNAEPGELNIFLPAMAGLFVTLLLGAAFGVFWILKLAGITRAVKGHPLTDGIRDAGLSLVGLVFFLIAVGIGILAVTAIIEFARRLF
jgi:hypothetical protein